VEQVVFESRKLSAILEIRSDQDIRRHFDDRGGQLPSIAISFLFILSLDMPMT